MSEPEEICFACIGCGAMNPAEAEVCSGCGHRFAGTDFIGSASPGHLLHSERFDDSPNVQVAPPPRFRIGTAMVFIALIAICLRAFVTHVALGILATLVLLPASIRVFLLSAERKLQGRPMAIREQVSTFWLTICGVMLVVISSASSFVYPCTLLGQLNPVLGIVVGSVTSLVVAFLVSRDLLRRERRSQRERDRFRWY